MKSNWKRNSIIYIVVFWQWLNTFLRSGGHSGPLSLKKYP